MMQRLIHSYISELTRASAMVCLVVAVRSVSADTTAVVDFSVRQDPPLVKKFALFNSGIISPYSNYARDLPKFDEVDAQSLRIDLSLGKNGTFGDVVSGSATNLSYDFTQLDDLAGKLNEKNILPYWSWCYVPVPLQKNGVWQDLDEGFADWTNVWREIHAAYSRHYRLAEIRVGYHEIYNEPDLSIFLHPDDFNFRYKDMYKYGVLGIREGDPDAVVGGPAYAIGEAMGSFVNYVRVFDLPLDFCSFHSYMDGGSWPFELDVVRNALDAHSQFNTTEIHLNELSWLNHGNGALDGANSPFNYYAAAAKTLETFAAVLPYTCITLVSWAQFMESTWGDDPYGMIRKTGERKAAFNALKLYADMPEERVNLDLTNADFGGFASATERKVCVLLWSKVASPRNVTIDFENVPFPSGIVRVYRIDQTHASYFDGAPETVIAEGIQTNAGMNEFTWEGMVPGNGVIYLVASDTDGLDDFDVRSDENPVARDIRLYHYFNERTKSHYAWFDRKRWKVFLGMGSEDWAHSAAGVCAEDVPRLLRVNARVTGNLQMLDENSLLAVRVDYNDGGGYSKGVLFHDGWYQDGRTATVPWGTGRLPDRVVQVSSLSDAVLDIRANAPAGWDDGRVIISTEMQNMGADTRAEVRFSNARADIASVTLSGSDLILQWPVEGGDRVLSTADLVGGVFSDAFATVTASNDTNEATVPLGSEAAEFLATGTIDTW